MARRNIVVIGGSTGAIEATIQILQTLPSDFRGAVFLVIHTAPDGPCYLAEIFSQHSAVPVVYPNQGEYFTSGKVYLAPPNFHLLVEAPCRTLLLKGARENRTRPAIDPLFRSAALAFGTRVIGVILSGGLDDGAVGLRGIKLCGGTTIVQKPSDAVVPSMPESALRQVAIDYSLSAHEIGSLLPDLVQTSVSDDVQGDERFRKQLEIEENMIKGLGGDVVTELGEPSLFTCPECHGALIKIRGEQPSRFRCHTGHAFTAESLLAELKESTEAAIWNAMRSLQESSILLKHFAEHSSPELTPEFLSSAADAHDRAALLRQLVEEPEIEFELQRTASS
jgi:two-component system, chemotaxis family, protein-glutamate methylesterase/glutaminase